MNSKQKALPSLGANEISGRLLNPWFRSLTDLWNPMNDPASAPASEGGEVDFWTFDFSPDREHVPKADIVKKDKNRFFEFDGFKEV